MSPATKVAQMSPATKVAQISPATKVAQMSPATKVAQISPATKVAQMSPATKVAQISPATKVAQISPATKVAQISPAESVAPATSLAKISPADTIGTFDSTPRTRLSVGSAPQKRNSFDEPSVQKNAECVECAKDMHCTVDVSSLCIFRGRMRHFRSGVLHPKLPRNSPQHQVRRDKMHNDPCGAASVSSL
jgi:hypothetical protein